MYGFSYTHTIKKKLNKKYLATDDASQHWLLVCGQIEK